MTAVAAGTAEYLQAPALYSPLTDATAKARWGDQGRESSVVSPIDAKADADAELARQLEFMKQPHVRERIQMPFVDIETYRGRCITLRAVAPGFEGAGALCFVLGGTPDEARGLITIEFLRRLAS